ncbi:hypothetical protein ABZ807_09555 [Micromonospora sp. NPDC047548]|uniref:hypothetical protein n=1 Tax=Micromonospora sp. NPDC047548 TaxID=3155624 RepID=UPI0033E47D50
MPHRATRDHAVVFVPATTTDPAEFAAVAAPCLERVEACGYVFAGIVRTWPDARELMEQGRAHVVVVADRGHLPADRRPRVETVNDAVRVNPAQQHVVPPEVTAPKVRRPRRVR